MRQIEITGRGGANTFALRELPDPSPGEHEVRIRVRSSGVNFADTLVTKGLYPDAPALPCVVGYEVSGVVDCAGPMAGDDLIGTEVFGLTRFKGYADTVVIPRSQVFAKPTSLSHDQAAALPVNYLTAWQLLVVMGGLKSGETVLIHNVGGGVGLAALEIARHIGARTIGTASTRKHPFLAERGLDHVFDYTLGDWRSEVDRITDGRGVEVILDPLGGGHWKRSYAALRHTGRLGMFGISTVTDSRLSGPLRLLKVGLTLPWFNPLQLMNNNRAVYGVNLGHLWHETGKLREWMEQILDGVEHGWVCPYVDKVFALEDAAKAHAYLEGRHNIGKIVLNPGLLSG
jgi:NADPH:quinone reductase-like Zn-dependent oxidoreductase